MARRIGAAFLGVSVLVSSPLQAREHYYFNKPNVSRDKFVADRVACDRLAGGVGAQGPQTIYVPQYSNLTAGQNAAAVGIAMLFAGLLAGGERRKVMRAVERTCMADKGYGRYRVEKEVVRNIDKMKSQDARVDHYFALAASTQPVGERIKE